MTSELKKNKTKQKNKQKNPPRPILKITDDMNEGAER